jgi:hypothetical protein
MEFDTEVVSSAATAPPVSESESIAPAPETAAGRAANADPYQGVIDNLNSQFAPPAEQTDSPPDAEPLAQTENAETPPAPPAPENAPPAAETLREHPFLTPEEITALFPARSVSNKALALISEMSAKGLEIWENSRTATESLGKIGGLAAIPTWERMLPLLAHPAPDADTASELFGYLEQVNPALGEQLDAALLNTLGETPEGATPDELRQWNALQSQIVSRIAGGDITADEIRAYVQAQQLGLIEAGAARAAVDNHLNGQDPARAAEREQLASVQRQLDDQAKAHDAQARQYAQAQAQQAQAAHQQAQQTLAAPILAQYGFAPAPNDAPPLQQAKMLLGQAVMQAARAKIGQLADAQQAANFRRLGQTGHLAYAVKAEAERNAFEAALRQSAADLQKAMALLGGNTKNLPPKGGAEQETANAGPRGNIYRAAPSVAPAPNAGQDPYETVINEMNAKLRGAV